MANNWKYGTLGQRERLKMIKGGNTELYNYEKERNKQLKAAQTAVGASTADVDNWDAIIDDAMTRANQSKSSAGRTKIGTIPKELEEYNKEMSYLTGQRDDAIAELENNKSKSLANLTEWLANNGFSEKGYTFKKSKKELEDSFARLLNGIDRDYKYQADNIKKLIFG